MILKEYAEAALRLIYPAYCHVCSAFLKLEETALCTVCRAGLGAELLADSEREHTSPARPLKKCFSLYSYDGAASSVLAGAKTSIKPWLFGLFREEIERFAQTLPVYDALVPVPMNRLKFIQREFNPAETAASLLGKACGVPVRRLLSKPAATTPQRGLSRKERRMNLFGAFKPARKESIKGRTLLLVDDILTTGSTLSEAARILRDNGAARIDAFTLARVNEGAAASAAPARTELSFFERILP